MWAKASLSIIADRSFDYFRTSISRLYVLALLPLAKKKKVKSLTLIAVHNMKSRFSPWSRPVWCQSHSSLQLSCHTFTAWVNSQITWHDIHFKHSFLFFACVCPIFFSWLFVWLLNKHVEIREKSSKHTEQEGEFSSKSVYYLCVNTFPSKLSQQRLNRQETEAQIHQY